MVHRHRRRDIERLLEKRDSQGLTFRELSEESGIPIPTLSWWNRKLRTGHGRKADRVPLELVPVVVEEDTVATGRVEIWLNDDVRVVVGAEFNEAQLARVLRVLNSTC